MQLSLVKNSFVTNSAFCLASFAAVLPGSGQESTRRSNSDPVQQSSDNLLEANEFSSAESHHQERPHINSLLLKKVGDSVVLELTIPNPDMFSLTREEAERYQKRVISGLIDVLYGHDELLVLTNKFIIELLDHEQFQARSEAHLDNGLNRPMNSLNTHNVQIPVLLKNFTEEDVQKMRTNLDTLIKKCRDSSNPELLAAANRLVEYVADEVAQAAVKMNQDIKSKTRTGFSD